MARPKKKGQAGNAKNFITRTQAIRKLQISLPDFRRLCIFKGIFPREPRNKKKAAKHSTPAATFYYARDIQYLLHEPLLEKFRQQKALAKKIGRLLGRNEVKDAARVEKQLAPRMTLDHIVKERYPTFVDALRDLDDCLCMLYLFANLPSTDAVPAKTIALCQRLVLEFEHYLIVSHSLRKSFLSIKGIYYQATIQGQDILWLVPYKFVQRTAGDIDFRIMGTFVEFYTTLLGFVNFRLYTTLGLVYPPRFDQSREDAGAELAALTLEGSAVDEDTGMESANAAAPVTKVLTGAASSAKAQKAADTISATAHNTNDEVDEDEEPSTTIDEFIPAAEGADVLPQPTHSSHVASTLFVPFVFYLSRETPRAPLEFLLKSFGCKRVGWDAVLGEGAWTADEKDSRITHQIVDRPPVTAEVAGADGGVKGRVSGRIYVQPQWVWDCVNAGKLLRPDHYAPGMTLPPHLSPWGRVKRGGYDPTKPLDPQDDDVEEDEQPDIAGEDEQEDADDDEDLPEVAPEDADDALSDDEEGDGIALAPEAPNEDDFEGFSEEDEDDVAQMQRELEAEAKGLTVPSAKSDKKKAAEARKRKSEKARRDQAEELERQKMMLPRRKRKLLEKMIYSNAQTEGEADKLKAKRRRLEREQAAKAL